MNTHQVGARGPRVRDPLPQGVRRDRPAGRRAGAEPRRVPRRRHRRSVSGDLRERQDPQPRSPAGPKHYYSIYQKMIVRGRDFADIYDLVGIRVLVDSVRDCYAALGSDPRAVEPGPGPVQGLHRDAQVQHVPVAAHDGHRARGQAGRAADPHLRHAPPRRVRHRRALEVQGGPRGAAQVRRTGSRDASRRGRPARQRHGLAAPAARLAEGDRGPGRVPRVPALRPQVRARSSSSRRRATSSRCRPARPRSTSPTPCTPRSATAASAPGSTAGWCRWRARWTTATWSRSSPPRPQGAGPSRDWLTLRQEPAGPQQDPRLVLQGAPRGGDRAGQGRHRPGDAQAEPADPAPAHRRVAHHARPRAALPRHLRAVRRDRRGPRLRAVRRQRLVESLGGEEGATEDLAEVVAARRAATAGAAPPTPASWSRAPTDVWVKLARCCTPVPGDAIVGFVTRGSGVSVHRADCVNVGRAHRAARADGRGRVGARRRPRCSWSPSRSRRWTGPGCCPTSPGCCPTSTSTSCPPSVTTTRDRVAMSRFTFEMGDPKHLGHVLQAVRGVDGVFDVYRVTSGKA